MEKGKYKNMGICKMRLIEVYKITNCCKTAINEQLPMFSLGVKNMDL